MCEQCELINSKYVVGGDPDIAIIVPPHAAPTAVIVPKQHARLEELPAAVQEKLLVTANSLSTMIFEQLSAHGTNILISDEQHAAYSIVARTEEDGVDLRWKPQQATPDELSEAAKRINEETWYIGKQDKKPEAKPKTYAQHETEGSLAKISVGKHADEASPDDDDPTVETPTETAEKVQTKVKKEKSDEHNYLLKQLARRR